MPDSTLGRIWELAKSPSPESARLLIRMHEESEWRSIRLEVIRALGHFSDNRSLPFLVELIRRNEDLAEQELAIRSLARQKSRGARLFLHSFYPDAPNELRASTASALGLVQDHESSPRLLEDLGKALKSKNPLWLKNLILALGELKEIRALPGIHRILEESDGSERDLDLALLFALGRLEREPSRISRYEARFLDESILWQVYQSTLSQVQIRSQFKLEDYLQKIFESDRPHPMLPFELRSFDPEEVEAGLSIFPKGPYLKRHMLSLRAFAPERASRMLEDLAAPGTDWKTFFEAWIETGCAGIDSAAAESILRSAGGESMSLELRLDWMEAFLPVVDFARESGRFLNVSEDRLATRFVNLWSERAIAEPESGTRAHVRSFLKFGLREAVFSRLVRALVELSIEEESIEKEWADRFRNPKNRTALLMYAEQFAYLGAKDLVLNLSPQEVQPLLSRILAYLEALGKAGKLKVSDSRVEGFLQEVWKGAGPERVGVLRVLRSVPIPSLQGVVLSALGQKDDSLSLNAVIAGKAFPASREIAESLDGFLGSESDVFRGRALDSILSNTTLVAKRASLRHLKDHIFDEDVVDKIFRDFDPEKKGGEEFAQEVHELLKKFPDHPQWEKLVSLRDRIRPKSAAGAEHPGAGPVNPEVSDIDARLLQYIPAFSSLDLTAKLALRAAEQPFLRSEDLGNLPIDKAPSVLEFCKALDLVLEKQLGQRILFPRLDRELHEFQTLWHRVGFGEEYPRMERVLPLLGLRGKITPELFPLHKAKQMCGSFFNGKIVQDRFKIFDGLRAWAVILLVFSRKLVLDGAEISPLLKLPHLSEEKIILMCKRLMQLQDLRNPAAHRQTFPELDSVKGVRSETIELINLIMHQGDSYFASGLILILHQG